LKKILLSILPSTSDRVARYKVSWPKVAPPMLLAAISTGLFTHQVQAKTITPDDMAGRQIIPIEQAQQAPKFRHGLPNLNSSSASQLSLSDFKGKVVLLDFWASWCGPCRASFPWMNKVMTKHQNSGFEVIAINLDQEVALAEEFLSQVPANFTILQDENAVMPEAYGLIGMPSSYLIDRKGYLRAVHIGFHANKEDEYEAAIMTLLKE